MKMSTILTAVVTAVGSAGCLASTSSSILTSTITSSASSQVRRSAIRGGIANAKRRRAFGSRCKYSSMNNNLRAFSSLHQSQLGTSCAFIGASSNNRYFSKSKLTYHGPWTPDNLPWTPIREVTETEINPSSSPSSTSLQMTPNYGTEGFRDAIRGGQEYLKPRGPKERKTEYQKEQAARPQQSQSTSQQPIQDQTNNNKPKQQQKQRIPFPKLTPGRKRNYRPPHVISALQQSSFGNAYQTDDIQFNPSASSDEKDYCDALNPDEREHCLENFRDGIESTKYLSVKGPSAQEIVDKLPKTGERIVDIVNGDDKIEKDKEEEESLSEHFRENGTRKGNGISGSDVEYIDDLLDDISDGDNGNNPIKQLGKKRKKSHHDDTLGQSSMNFRDGRSHMARYKDSAFTVPLSEYVSEREKLVDEESSSSGSLYDDDDDELLDDEDIDKDDDGDTKVDFMLRDAVDEEIDKILRERKKFEQSIREDKDDDIDSVSNELPQISTKKDSADIESTSSSSSSKLLSIDPKSIDIIPLKKGKAEEEGLSTDSDDNESIFKRSSSLDSLYATTTNSPTSPTLFSDGWEGIASSGSFVKMFRGSASYIANHRSTLAVYHIPGELLAWEGFPGLMDDIALTWLLGMKIVLVAGCRHQIDLRLEEDEDEYSDENLGGKVMMSSIRVTDEETLRVVKEEAGFVRFEIERRLAKSLRLHGGLVKGSESLVGNVVSGNFYSAQPFGVVDGVDYCWTGFPRKIETERIRQVHETHDIVLLTSLGVSPSGEIFNVNSEFLAATAAGALSASKIIYFNVHGTSFQNKVTGKPVQNLRVSDAKNLLAHHKMRIHPKGFALVDLDGDSPQQSVLRTPGSMETLIKVGYSMVALEKGVKRAHILAPENGALVQELYTRDGCGTLISRDIYEGIRRANVNDVSGIYDLIDPLVKMGTLVERPKSKLEKEILSYYVYTRDDLVVATGQLKRFEGGFAEIGCLVVSKDYRRGGRGDAMLGYLERLALQCGAKKVFVLSTQTMEWFVERGFKAVPVEVRLNIGLVCYLLDMLCLILFYFRYTFNRACHLVDKLSTIQNERVRYI